MSIVLAAALACPLPSPIAARNEAPGFCADLGAERAACEEGRRIFFARELSADKQASCASCHASDLLGDDRAAPKLRAKVLPGSRTKNLRDISRRQGGYFWNGRAKTLAGATFWPLYNPHEIDADPKVLAGWGGDRAVAEKLALFLKTQNSAPAAIDAYARGNCSALNPRVLSGLKIFQEKNCARCHAGSEGDSPALQSYVYEDLPQDIFRLGEARYGATWQLHGEFQKRLELRVKVPPLRNLRPPFGQFAQFQDLEAYLKKHGEQVGRLHESEATALRIFLSEALVSPEAL